MHRVNVYGPEDHLLCRLLVNVADFADVKGCNAVVGTRLLADRLRVGYHKTRSLLEEAIAAGWLIVDNPGGPRRRTVYNLGPRFVERSVTRPIGTAGVPTSAQPGAYLRDPSAQPGPRTSNGIGRSRTAALPPKGGGRPAVENPRAARSETGPHAELLDTNRIDPHAVACPDCHGYRRVINDAGYAIDCTHPHLANGTGP
jgi:hypothetical protein